MATVTSQLTVHARGTSGLAVAALDAAVFTRGIGDTVAHHGSWLSWFSPIAWTQQLRVYIDVRVWPLGLSVLAIAVLLMLGAVLASRRDLGEALVHERTGRADATAALRSPFALAVQQQRTALLWWLIGCITMFGLSGLFIARGAEDVLAVIANQNALTHLIFGDDPIAAFWAIMMLHNVLAVAVYAITGELRIKPEDEGRRGLGLSGSVTSTEVLLSKLGVVALGAFILLFVSGAMALWLGAVASGGTST